MGGGKLKIPSFQLWLVFLVTGPPGVTSLEQEILLFVLLWLRNLPGFYELCQAPGVAETNTDISSYFTQGNKMSKRDS